MKLDQLHEANGPAITIIDADGYLHFIIIKGLTKQEVLVGDPAIGVDIIPRDKFEEMWGDRILFMVHAEKWNPGKKLSKSGGVADAHGSGG